MRLFPVPGQPGDAAAAPAGPAIFTDELPEEAAGFRSFGDFFGICPPAAPGHQPQNAGGPCDAAHRRGLCPPSAYAGGNGADENAAAPSHGAGALGLSSGLIYIPGVYAKYPGADRTVPRGGGIRRHLRHHMRNESKDVVQAVKEAIAVAERSRGAFADLPP